MREKFYNQNSYYEGLLQNFYGGSKGCFSLFMSFFYQFNQIKIFAPDLSDVFKKLCCLEIENCEILSQIILNMGGDSKFYSSSRKFLSGNNVDYIKNVKRMISVDIEFLEMGVIESKNIIGKIESENIKNELKKVLNNKRSALKILKEIWLKNNLIE